MDLWSGRLYWPGTDAPAAHDGPLDADAGCDVLVVGAGITGAMAAAHLAEAGVAVIVVDRRDVLSGSTPASTALVQYELDLPLTELAGRVGRGRAERAYRGARAALDRIAALTGRLGSGVGLAERPSVYLARCNEDVAVLAAECEARARIGLEVELLDGGELRRRFGMRRPGALLSAVALEVNPVRLTHRLLERARGLGARVHPRTEVELPESLDAGSVRTAAGARVGCRHVVIATGYETPEQFGALGGLTELRSTYALASLPLPGGEEAWPGRALVWEMGDPYFYMRTTPDGRVLAGGEDEGVVEAAARDALIVDKARRLTERVGGLVEGLRIEPEFAWAGTFARTADGLPYIGEHPRWARVHFALGYGGNGITFSIIAAEIIRERILGRVHAADDLFGFGRGG